MVQLFEKGYGKDAAGIAMEAIAFGTCTGNVWAWGVERVLLSLGTVGICPEDQASATRLNC